MVTLLTLTNGERIEPLTAVVLTVIVFHVPFNAWEITGAACVILNMVLLALQDRKKEK